MSWSEHAKPTSSKSQNTALQLKLNWGRDAGGTISHSKCKSFWGALPYATASLFWYIDQQNIVRNHFS